MQSNSLLHGRPVAVVAAALTYEGDHTNMVVERLETKVLPSTGR